VAGTDAALHASGEIAWTGRRRAWPGQPASSRGLASEVGLQRQHACAGRCPAHRETLKWMAWPPSAMAATPAPCSSESASHRTSSRPPFSPARRRRATLKPFPQGAPPWRRTARQGAGSLALRGARVATDYMPSARVTVCTTDHAPTCHHMPPKSGRRPSFRPGAGRAGRGPAAGAPVKM